MNLKQFTKRRISLVCLYFLNSILFGCKPKETNDDMAMLFSAILLTQAPPIAMINLGDSLTNGDQSGSTHEFSQTSSFPQLLANQMRRRGSDVIWNNPYLNATGANAGLRKDPSLLPYNLGINGQTTKTLIGTTASTGGSTHIDKILSPIPEILGKPTTQLEAAEYIGKLNLDRTLIITLWIGGNDVLGAVTASSGSTMTAASINTFLSDTTAEHDLNSVKNNLNATVNRLKILPRAEIFLATLPDISGIGFLVTQSDIEKIAHTTDNLNITSFGSCQALGFGSLIGTSAANSLLGQLDGNNTTLNAVISGVAGNDGTCLTQAEGNLVTTRVNEINTYIRSLADANQNVHLVDIDAMFKRVLNGDVTVGGKVLGKTIGQGGVFSFDGVHPSNTGHGLIANVFIEEMNRKLGLNLANVDLALIQTTDPYRDDDRDGFAVGPNISVSPINASLSLHFPDCDDTNSNKYARIVHGGGGNTAGTCP
ncbi:SGNH/GDSL hydrolase family protein [Leptospira sp. 96542]|nr:SGNH/GDSL hydrolase family protein [Leptospira sp. 96542]